MAKQKMVLIRVAEMKNREFAMRYFLLILKMDSFNLINLFNQLEDKKMTKESVLKVASMQLMKA